MQPSETGSAQQVAASVDARQSFPRPPRRHTIQMAVLGFIGTADLAHRLQFSSPVKSNGWPGR